MEMFHYVTQIIIDCGLQVKPTKRCNEHLPCQTMLCVSYFVKQDSVCSGY